MPETDPTLNRLVGNLEGQIAEIRSVFVDERSQGRAFRDKSEEKLDKIEDKLSRVEDKMDDFIRERESKDKEFHSLSDRVQVLYAAQGNSMGIGGVLGGLLVMFGSGLWWIITHWAEIGAWIRTLFGPRGP